MTSTQLVSRKIALSSTDWTKKTTLNIIYPVNISLGRKFLLLSHSCNIQTPFMNFNLFFFYSYYFFQRFSVYIYFLFATIFCALYIFYFTILFWLLFETYLYFPIKYRIYYQFVWLKFWFFVTLFNWKI